MTGGGNRTQTPGITIERKTDHSTLDTLFRNCKIFKTKNDSEVQKKKVCAIHLLVKKKRFIYSQLLSKNYNEKKKTVEEEEGTM